MTDREFWISAWTRERARYIREYLSVKPTTNKVNLHYFRDRALHYGRLVRKLKRGAV